MSTCTALPRSAPPHLNATGLTTRSMYCRQWKKVEDEKCWKETEESETRTRTEEK